MNILITGGTGFLGKSLCLELCKLGHRITIVSRRPDRVAAQWGIPSRFMTWNPVTQPCPESLEDYDAVINLMGESIADRRWTPAQKKLIYDSRVGATRNLILALEKRQKRLPVLISASAIGIYPYDDPQPFTEQAPQGQHFLAEVCRDWEAAAMASKKVDRVVVLRIGVVLGAEGGALQKMLLPFKAGVGGAIGHGRQIVSWIHVDDLVQTILTSLTTPSYSGVINCMSPDPVSNEELITAIGLKLGRPSFLPAPAFALRSILGEMSEIVLRGQHVVPEKLLRLGFKFRYPTLNEALHEALNMVERDGVQLACQRLSAVQFVPRPIDEVFKFFCDPYNLERITPPLLSFKIKDVSTPEIREGTLINYRLKVHGVPMAWRTRIEEWRVQERFVDNQLRGPYRIWHHTHGFYSIPEGTLMTDLVRYRVPLGLLGEWVALPLVKHDVKKIFGYRRKVIEELFTKQARN